MTLFAYRNRIIACSVLFITLFVYLRTMPPTVTFWDCGEYITTSYIMGVPHPPGAPTYTLLGRIFTLLPFGEIAFRVNLLSVLSGVATVVLIYLCVVRLLSAYLRPDNAENHPAIFTGGAVAALSVAFSTSFWNNAGDSEVYALSITFTMLAVYVILRWDTAEQGQSRDRLLLLMAYLFGLGAGVRLTCLLTLPGILIIVFSDLLKNRPAGQQIKIAIALALYPFLSILLPFPIAVLMTLSIVAGMIYLQPAWRSPAFWAMGFLLAGLGYSTYLTLAIRSGLGPFIDMNNPENWENFKAFLTREQYGAHSLFPRRGEFWAYQMNIFTKYFLLQFPFFDAIPGTFRRAVDVFQGSYEIIRFSAIPILLGLGGMAYHLRNDWRRFAAIFSIFALLGFGLVLYLNMPDPEPRERDYIFVGAYAFFGFWIGIGAAGFIAYMKANTRLPWVVAPLLMLVIPAGILSNNYFSHNRSGDYIAYNYAYNILQTCEPNAILFTNGDNDTYPLWFLQAVEGIRTDVQIINLSLIKTTWYIKQMQRAGVPFNLSDDWIDRNLVLLPWEADQGREVAGLKLEPDDIPKVEYAVGSQPILFLEPQTYLIWRLLEQNNWERPIYFAVTAPDVNMAGLRPYTSMEGMAYRIVDERGPGQQLDIERTAHNLLNVYRYTGLSDPGIYKDPVARRLLGNYVVIFQYLCQAYMQSERYKEAFDLLGELEKRVPPHALDMPETWQIAGQTYRDLAIEFAEMGEIDLALASLENLLRLGPPVQNPEQIRALMEQWKNRQDTLPADSPAEQQ